MGKHHALLNPALTSAMPGADATEVLLEKDLPGQPHKGKVFAAVHAHLDDSPYYLRQADARRLHRLHRPHEQR